MVCGQIPRDRLNCQQVSPFSQHQLLVKLSYEVILLCDYHSELAEVLRLRIKVAVVLLRKSDQITRLAVPLRQ